MQSTFSPANTFAVLMALSLGACLFSAGGKGGSGDSGDWGWGGTSSSEEDAHDHDHHDQNHGHEHDDDLITTVVLTFEDASSGERFVYRWADPTGDGSEVQFDDILLDSGAEYDLTVQVLDELEDPAVDLTPEIADHGDEYQFFFTGDGISGPASSSAAPLLVHEYADSDANGLPIGLANTMSVVASGAGELGVTLRHMPMEDGQPTKVEGLTEWVAEDGFSGMPGYNEFQVYFSVEVD